MPIETDTDAMIESNKALSDKIDAHLRDNARRERDLEIGQWLSDMADNEGNMTKRKLLRALALEVIDPAHVDGFEPETFECATCGGRFAMERRACGVRAPICEECDAVDPDNDDHDAACDAARDEARERYPI